jgi:hypothetical protein
MSDQHETPYETPYETPIDNLWITARMLQHSGKPRSVLYFSDLADLCADALSNKGMVSPEDRHILMKKYSAEHALMVESSLPEHLRRICLQHEGWSIYLRRATETATDIENLESGKSQPLLCADHLMRYC